MRGMLVVLGLVMLACLAYTHWLDVQIQSQRLAWDEASHEYELWRGSPAGRRSWELELQENRLKQALARLQSHNQGIELLLAALDGLGAQLVGVRIRNGQVEVEVARDPKAALARLQRLPGASAWEELGPNRVGGEFLP